MPVDIGTNKYRTKKEAEENIRSLFNKIGVCDSIRKRTNHYSYIIDLVKRHPDYDTKCSDITDFKLIPNKLNKNALE